VKIQNDAFILSFFLRNLTFQERTGPNSLGGNTFYKSHMDIAEKASHHTQSLKSLAILEKASISLKKSLKIITIFIKAPHF
jgi:hypothetical protein